jgi:hypothetical protein
LHLSYLAIPFMMDIPTVADFLASKDVIYDDDHNSNCATVARIGKYVMKYNGRTRVAEADALRYLAANTNVPVPNCYGSGDLPNSHKKYVIMDFIEGVTLEKLWPDLSAADKDEIVRQLHKHVTEYRNLPPPNYLGAVVKGPLPHAFFRMLNGEDPTFAGPFRDAQHFKDALVARIGLLTYGTPGLGEVMGMQIEETLGDFRTVFTHADLARKNIIVNKQGSNEDATGVFKVTIIDWELSGWYPEWWEWAQSPFWFSLANDGWQSVVPKIVPVYANEFWCWRMLWDWIDGING